MQPAAVFFHTAVTDFIETEQGSAVVCCYNLQWLILLFICTHICCVIINQNKKPCAEDKNAKNKIKGWCSGGKKKKVKIEVFVSYNWIIECDRDLHYM